MMRRLSGWIATVVLLASSVLGQVHADDDAPDRLDVVKQKGSLEFIVYRDYPPYSYEKDGAFTGVDVDMGTALAAALGVKAAFRTFIPGDDLDDDLRNQLWRGTIVGGSVGDVMLHVGADPQYVARQDKVAIFGVYFREAVALSYDTTQFPNWSTIGDLKGKRVGVELGSISDQFLTTTEGGSLSKSVTRYTTLDDCVKAYTAGKLDAVLAPKGELQGLMHAHGAKASLAAPQPIQFQGIFRSAWEIGIAVKKDSPKLKTALADAMARLVESGELKAIYARHGIDYATPGLR